LLLRLRPFPNPYSDRFRLALDSASQEPVGITVYDMMGKVVAHYECAANEARSVAIGTDYPVGMYNVVVIQGDEVKTVRVMKR